MPRSSVTSLAYGSLRASATLASGLVLALAACGTPELDPSPSGRVVQKSGDVWGRDLANGLGLEESALCRELGTYDCIKDAHLITLGGVEPASLGIDEPLPHPTVSAPIAIDRVAMSACGERFSRDSAGSPIVFGPVLESDTKGHREEVATALIQRILARKPTDAELSGLADDLYATIGEVSDDPVRDWSIGACTVVATSTEALFY